MTWFLISISLLFTIILSTQTKESESTTICEITVLRTAYIGIFSTFFSCLREFVYFYNNYNDGHRFLSSLLESHLSRGHVRSKFFAVNNAGWEWRNWMCLCSTYLELSALTTGQQIGKKKKIPSGLCYSSLGRGFFFNILPLQIYCHSRFFWFCYQILCIVLPVVLVHFIHRLLKITITQYSSKPCVVRQGYRWISFEHNSLVSLLQILWLWRGAAQHGPLLSSTPHA